MNLCNDTNVPPGILHDTSQIQKALENCFVLSQESQRKEREAPRGVLLGEHLHTMLFYFSKQLRVKYICDTCDKMTASVRMEKASESPKRKVKLIAGNLPFISLSPNEKAPFLAHCASVIPFSKSDSLILKNAIRKDIISGYILFSIPLCHLSTYCSGPLQCKTLQRKQLSPELFLSLLWVTLN